MLRLCVYTVVDPSEPRTRKITRERTRESCYQSVIQPPSFFGMGGTAYPTPSSQPSITSQSTSLTYAIRNSDQVFLSPLSTSSWAECDSLRKGTPPILPRVCKLLTVDAAPGKALGSASHYAQLWYHQNVAWRPTCSFWGRDWMLTLCVRLEMIVSSIAASVAMQYSPLNDMAACCNILFCLTSVSTGWSGLFSSLSSISKL